MEAEWNAPTVPEGYEPQGELRPLLGFSDSLWCAWAKDVEGVEGLLLLDESGRKILFFMFEECITLLATFLEKPDLLNHCSSDYLEEHQEDVKRIYNNVKS